jgi:hypothetical protein
MRLPDRGQGLTPTESVGRGLILRTALPAQWTADGLSITPKYLKCSTLSNL